MANNLVIVESPAKAKTIEKYLGKDFHVLSSVGHIRKDTKVDVDNNFAVTYEVDPGHTKVVSELKKAAKSAQTIWLATDEDREGESISWHLIEVLKLPADTRRITFHEITKPALEAAIQHPRTVDMHMVSSQQARQTLDMLVGYDLSGVVRRKVPGAISAGRVQSPALRLIVEREQEIADFGEKFTFKVTGNFFNSQNVPDPARLKTPETPETTETFPATLEKITPTTEAEAKTLLSRLQNRPFQVTAVDQSEGTKANPVPFATAALQIEANSRLGFSSSTTMRAAQGLYQAGHITYHRTDSLNLSAQALASIAQYIEETYGKNYLKVRHFKTKSAGAQEAHEAIRPTNIQLEVAGANDYERRLYHLIRTRTLATQMANAKVAKTTISLQPLDENGQPINFTPGATPVNTPEEKTAPSSNYIPSGDKSGRSSGKIASSLSTRNYRLDTLDEKSQPQTAKSPKKSPKNQAKPLIFTAKGEIVIFDGFLKVYGKSKDTELPPLKQGDLVNYQNITARQNFAKPPARYTEGSLVKKLEELGIGRPSTYASIMSAIQARGYVNKGESEGTPREVIELTIGEKPVDGGISAKTKNVESPTSEGEGVGRFVEGYPQVTTASSKVASGEETSFLSRTTAGAAPEGEAKRRVPVTTGDANAVRDGMTYSSARSGKVTRSIVTEKTGATKGKLVPTPVGELVAGFLTENFNQIVDYNFTAGIEEKLDLIAENKLNRVKMLRDFYTPFAELVGASAMLNRYNSATELGTDPKTGKPIFAKIGKNGGFIQLGANEKESGEKPRFAPLPAGADVKTVTLEQALQQLALPALPRSLGQAKDGTELIAAGGPFGPYLKAGKYNIPLKGEDPYTVTLATAEKFYAEKKASIIADWDEIMIINGAYGPYIKGPGRRNNLKIPKDLDPKSITREEAEKMLAEKGKPTTAKASKSAKSTKSAKSSKSKKSTTKTTKTATKSAAKTTKTTKKSTRHAPHSRTRKSTKTKASKN